jgi:hypothetical protein
MKRMGKYKICTSMQENEPCTFSVMHGALGRFTTSLDSGKTVHQTITLVKNYTKYSLLVIPAQQMPDELTIKLTYNLKSPYEWKIWYATNDPNYSFGSSEMEDRTFTNADYIDEIRLEAEDKYIPGPAPFDPKDLPDNLAYCKFRLDHTKNGTKDRIIAWGIKGSYLKVIDFTDKGTDKKLSVSSPNFVNGDYATGNYSFEYQDTMPLGKEKSARYIMTFTISNDKDVVLTYDKKDGSRWGGSGSEVKKDSVRCALIPLKNDIDPNPSPASVEDGKTERKT